MPISTPSPVRHRDRARRRQPGLCQTTRRHEAVAAVAARAAQHQHGARRPALLDGLRHRGTRVFHQRIALSMGDAAREAGVAIVTGDTKVVECGKADGAFITTTGIGVVPAALALASW